MLRMTLANLCSICLKWSGGFWLPSRAYQIHIQCAGVLFSSLCSLATYLPPLLLHKVGEKSFGRVNGWLYQRNKAKWSCIFSSAAQDRVPSLDPWDTTTPWQNPRSLLGQPGLGRRRPGLWHPVHHLIALWAFLLPSVKSDSGYLCFVLSRAIMRLKWDNVCKALCKL